MDDDSFPRGGMQVLGQLEMRDITRKAEADALFEVSSMQWL